MHDHTKKCVKTGYDPQCERCKEIDQILLEASARFDEVS